MQYQGITLNSIFHGTDKNFKFGIHRYVLLFPVWVNIARERVNYFIFFFHGFPVQNVNMLHFLAYVLNHIKFEILSI